MANGLSTNIETTVKTLPRFHMDTKRMNPKLPQTPITPIFISCMRVHKSVVCLTKLFFYLNMHQEGLVHDPIADPSSTEEGHVIVPTDIKGFVFSFPKQLQGFHIPHLISNQSGQQPKSIVPVRAASKQLQDYHMPHLIPDQSGQQPVSDARCNFDDISQITNDHVVTKPCGFPQVE